MFPRGIRKVILDEVQEISTDQEQEMITITRMSLQS